MRRGKKPTRIKIGEYIASSLDSVMMRVKIELEKMLLKEMPAKYMSNVSYRWNMMMDETNDKSYIILCIKIKTSEGVKEISARYDVNELHYSEYICKEKIVMMCKKVCEIIEDDEKATKIFQEISNLLYENRENLKEVDYLKLYNKLSKIKDCKRPIIC